MQAIEQDLKEVKKSSEYAHKEIDDLKKENVRKAQVEKESTERIQKLEADNAALMNSVIDLKARSMRDNLLFYNLQENRDENTTEVIQNLLGEKLGLENAKISRLIVLIAWVRRNQERASRDQLLQSSISIRTK